MPLSGAAQTEYQRQWIAARRAAWFDNKECAKCGSKENLEIHHKDPEQKVEHRVWSWAQARRDAELDKCEVLCHACHEVETLFQAIKLEHGTCSMYMKHSCRCAECVRAASYKREKQRLFGGRKHQPSYCRSSSSGRALAL